MKRKGGKGKKMEGKGGKGDTGLHFLYDLPAPLEIGLLANFPIN